jgi:hypothetical protein
MQPETLTWNGVFCAYVSGRGLIASIQQIGGEDLAAGDGAHGGKGGVFHGP